jgi:hypothetical protein
MQITEIAYRINTIKLYYLNLLRRLILHPLLVTLGRDTSITSKPTSLPPTPNTQLLGYLITYLLEGLFNPNLEAYFLFFRGSRIGLASSLSLFL